jgi:ketosteroid isomerase-like protein
MQRCGRLGVGMLTAATLVAGPFWIRGARAQVVPGRDDARAVGALEAQYRAYILDEIGPLMADWRAAWLVDDADAAARTYAEDALLVPDGGAPLLGRDPIGWYFEDLMPKAGMAMAGMADFDVSEGIAYQYGDYRYPFRAGGRASEVSGRHLTVIEKSDEWGIRAQVVIPERGTNPEIRASRGRAPVRTLTPARIWIGPLRCVRETSEQSRASRRRASGQRRAPEPSCRWLEATFAAVNTALVEWTDAWRRNDVEDAVEAFAEHSLLLLPGEETHIGSEQVQTALERMIDVSGDLHASIVDFAARGEMAYAYGRYVCACGSGSRSDELGHYMAVLKLDKDDWRIRALAMWVDPSEVQP